MIWVEFVNLLVILSSHTAFGTVVNFVALTVIAEFDDYVYSSLKSEGLAGLIDDDVSRKVFVIRHTSSRRCLATERSDVKKPKEDI